MVPSAHLGKGSGSDQPPLGSSHRSDVLTARRLAYETCRVTGGSVLNPSSARSIITEYAEATANGEGVHYADPTAMRDWDSAGDLVRKLVAPEEPEDALEDLLQRATAAKAARVAAEANAKL